jgi:hypothetical protein
MRTPMLAVASVLAVGEPPGTYPGAWWELHQFSVDSEGNLYGADSFNGRAQKFRPKAGADKSRLVGQMVPLMTAAR